MSRFFSQVSEIIESAHQSFSKEERPYAVHIDSRQQGIPRINKRFRQFKSTTRLPGHWFFLTIKKPDIPARYFLTKFNPRTSDANSLVAWFFMISQRSDRCIADQMALQGDITRAQG